MASLRTSLSCLLAGTLLCLLSLATPSLAQYYPSSHPPDILLEPEGVESRADLDAPFTPRVTKWRDRSVEAFVGTNAYRSGTFYDGIPATAPSQYFDLPQFNPSYNGTIFDDDAPRSVFQLTPTIPPDSPNPGALPEPLDFHSFTMYLVLRVPSSSTCVNFTFAPRTFEGCMLAGTTDGETDGLPGSWQLFINDQTTQLRLYRDNTSLAPLAADVFLPPLRLDWLNVIQISVNGLEGNISIKNRGDGSNPRGQNASFALEFPWNPTSTLPAFLAGPNPQPATAGTDPTERVGMRYFEGEMFEMQMYLENGVDQASQGFNEPQTKLNDQERASIFDFLVAKWRHISDPPSNSSSSSTGAADNSTGVGSSTGPADSSTGDASSSTGDSSSSSSTGSSSLSPASSVYDPIRLEMAFLTGGREGKGEEGFDAKDYQLGLQADLARYFEVPVKYVPIYEVFGRPTNIMTVDLYSTARDAPTPIEPGMRTLTSYTSFSSHAEQSVTSAKSSFPTTFGRILRRLLAIYNTPETQAIQLESDRKNPASAIYDAAQYQYLSKLDPERVIKISPLPDSPSGELDGSDGTDGHRSQILGGVIGGFVALVLISVCVVYCIHRRTKQNQNGYDTGDLHMDPDGERTQQQQQQQQQRTRQFITPVDPRHSPDDLLEEPSGNRGGLDMDTLSDEREFEIRQTHRNSLDNGIELATASRPARPSQSQHVIATNMVSMPSDDEEDNDEDDHLRFGVASPSQAIPDRPFPVSLHDRD